jgi:hypothetical protein
MSKPHSEIVAMVERKQPGRLASRIAFLARFGLFLLCCVAKPLSLIRL